MAFHGTRDGLFIGGGNVRIAKGGNDTLAGLALGVAVGFDELDLAGLLDGFGKEEHERPVGAGADGKSIPAIKN